jgi:probable HAF family extracellular repeat protein
MLLAASTDARCRMRAAMAAAVLATAIALASAVPAWAQAPPSPSPPGACTPGRIVDFCSDVTPGCGFLLDNDVFTTIEAPGAILGTGPFGINNRGQIVGAYANADGTIHGFPLDDGVFTSIEAPGAIRTGANDINEAGQIMGFYFGTNVGTVSR